MNRLAIPFLLAFYGSFFIGIIAGYLIGIIKMSKKISDIISYFIAMIYSLLPLYKFITFNSRMSRMFPLKLFSSDFSLFDLNPTIIGIISMLLFIAGWKLAMLLRKRLIQEL